MSSIGGLQEPSTGRGPRVSPAVLQLGQQDCLPFLFAFCHCGLDTAPHTAPTGFARCPRTPLPCHGEAYSGVHPQVQWQRAGGKLITTERLPPGGGRPTSRLTGRSNRGRACSLTVQQGLNVRGPDQSSRHAGAPRRLSVGASPRASTGTGADGRGRRAGQSGRWRHTEGPPGMPDSTPTPTALLQQPCRAS